MKAHPLSIPTRPAANGSGRLATVRFARWFWRWLREVTGDAAYERYLRYQRHSGSAAALSESEFYLDYLKRRYSSTSRCC